MWPLLPVSMKENLPMRNRVLVPLLLVLLVLLTGCQVARHTSSAPFVKTPYLQNPGQTEITLRWTADVRADCVVRYGVGRSLTHEAIISPFEAADTWTHEYLYRAKLSELEPGTRYRYAVVCGARTQEGTFRTSPARPEPFTFIAYGDSRTHWDIHEAVAECFPQHKPAFIIHTGDMVESGDFEEWQDQFFDPLASVIRDIPLWPARGNHEGDADVFGKLFIWPGDRLYYSFDYGNAHFVALDSINEFDGDAMCEWCDRDLAASKAEWKFVFYHYPSYDVGKYRGRWGRRDFLPLFRKHGVDFVLAGDSHSYQRFFPMYTEGENEDHPITHIVTAGGGAPMYWVNEDPHLAAGRAAFHYVVFRIDGDTLSFRTLTPDGEEIDALTVTKKNGRFNPEYLAMALSESTFGRFTASIEPFLRRLALPEVPTADRPVSLTFKLGAGKYPMRFEIRLDEQSAQSYDMAPVKGAVAADEQTDVTVSIRAREEAAATPGDYLFPELRLVCEYNINGRKGKAMSGVVVVRPPGGTDRP